MKALMLATLLAVVPACSSSKSGNSDKPDVKKPAPVASGTTWTGSIADESLEAQAPRDGLIQGDRGLQALRTAWKLGGEIKGVDMEKNLLLVATTRGSVISGKPVLDNKGDLKFTPISTRDLRPGFRYLIVVVSREGVKTVNGKAL